MGHIINALLIVILTAFISHADNWSWTKEDTARQVIATGLTLIDWGQTNDIVRREDIIELNPILGPNPSRQAVQNYFIAVLILQPLIARALPRECDLWGFKLNPRAAWQLVYIGVELTAVSSNFRSGLRMRF